MSTNDQGGKVIPISHKKHSAAPSTAPAEGGGSVVTRIVELKKRSNTVRVAMQMLPGWVTPNGVTAFRTLLVVPIMMLLVRQAYWAALGVLAVSMLLDFVDGALAEVRGLKSEFGAFLDPLGDKIVICGTLLALLGVLPDPFRFPVGAICTFALALTMLRIIKMARRQQGLKPVSVAAKPAGKIKTIVETVTLFLVLILLAAGLAGSTVIWVPFTLLCVAAALGGLSLLSQITG